MFDAASLRARLEETLAVRRPRVIGDDACDARAAVALILRAGPGNLPQAGAEVPGAEVLFVRRADAPGDPWSGHTALPGGRVSSADRNLMETARRETREETGLDLAPADFLGRLDDIHPLNAHLPSIAVTPFVAWPGGAGVVRESPELAGHVWIPVGALLDPTFRSWYRPPRLRERAYPAIAYAGEVIWGLTFKIVEDFLSRLECDAR
ncbi:MAG: NUDIX hydrolase [Gemmatimonadota bacterium]